MRPIISKAAPLLALFASFALTACGTRGNLTQLPVPAQPPILERWAPPTPAKPSPQPEPTAQPQGLGNLNTAAETAK